MPSFVMVASKTGCDWLQFMRHCVRKFIVRFTAFASYKAGGGPSVKQVVEHFDTVSPAFMLISLLSLRE